MSARIHVGYGTLPAAIMADPQALYRVTGRAALAAGLPYVHRRLALATPSGATGLARASVTSESGLGVAPVRGFVGYAGMSSRYIGFVNDGTRPHWPPIGPLAYWAARKFGYPVGSAQAQRAGYLVARAISRRGTKPRLFVERVVIKDGPQARRLMSDAIASAASQWRG
jgi:hypothetical protein